MHSKAISIATISLVRNADEENLLRRSLASLARLGLPLFITDGGSPAPFTEFLKSLPEASVFSAKGLWPQAKKSITEAAGAGAGWIFYTEPDKLDFFTSHLQTMITGAELNAETGVVLASRSFESFATFSHFQQMTEKTINHCCREIIGLEADYCYGPFLFNAVLLPLLDKLPEGCGWGWRPFLFASAHFAGLRLSAFTGGFSCPPEQQTDDAAERIYRMKQLTQNIEGLVMATASH